MYMDLTDMISGGTEEQQVPEQKLTKEEYAAKKQQEREEVWAEVEMSSCTCVKSSPSGNSSFKDANTRQKGLLASFPTICM